MPTGYRYSSVSCSKRKPNQLHGVLSVEQTRLAAGKLKLHGSVLNSRLSEGKDTPSFNLLLMCQE